MAREADESLKKEDQRADRRRFAVTEVRVGILHGLLGLFPQSTGQPRGA